MSDIIIKKITLCRKCYCSQTLPAEWQQCSCECHPKDRDTQGHIDTLTVQLAEAIRELAQYEWRPIAQIHEDFGTCALIDLREPFASIEIGSNLDLDFDAAYWTHFAQVPKLTTKRAEELIAALAPPSEAGA